MCRAVDAGSPASAALLCKPLPLGCAGCSCQAADEKPLHTAHPAVGQCCPRFVSFVDCIELHLARSGHSCAQINTATRKCQSRLGKNILLKKKLDLPVKEVGDIRLKKIFSSILSGMKYTIRLPSRELLKQLWSKSREVPVHTKLKFIFRRTATAASLKSARKLYVSNVVTSVLVI